MSEYSLLPPNKSRLEHAFEVAFTQLLYEIENPYPDFLNPHKTKPEMLPYLAQDRAVLEWLEGLSEEEHRSTVANAWPVARLAGTGKGLRLALEGLGFYAEITVWHEMEPKGDPYFFSITVRRDGFITEKLITQLKRSIGHSKSERDTYDLGVSIDTPPVGITTAQTARLATHERIDSHAGAEIQAGKTGITTAQTARLATHERIDSHAGAEIQAGKTGIATAQTARLITHERIAAQAGADINVNALLFRAASGMDAQIIIHMRLG